MDQVICMLHISHKVENDTNKIYQTYLGLYFTDPYAVCSIFITHFFHISCMVSEFIFYAKYFPHAAWTAMTFELMIKKCILNVFN